ncbi:O-antigen ligase family protein [Candidatus Saccharibacteria bacterium]|nr:O-antigen ligase family protein [Candidatus Saccharibacteria bacterium]MBQ6375699.1 O-antigen ligase family protein [Candidatus Saccharibacteria bacterium]
MKRLIKLLRWMIYAMPVALFFSYYPVISLGASESMNFELSVPLILLVVFDIIAMIVMIRTNKLGEVVRKWYYWLFPIFACLSIIWSDNVVRGVLTCGVLLAVYVAITAMVVLKNGLWAEREFGEILVRVFLTGALLVCVWCVVQCVLDLMGVPRECTLMCEGCTYRSFGFPHPNGLAIEPQFMGNLLIAPILVTTYLVRGTYMLSWAASPQPEKEYKRHQKILFLLLFVFASTLFLTFSRGAIYAGAVALIFMTTFTTAKAKKVERGKVVKRLGLTWGVVVLAFLFTLNLQGVMAAVSPTNDTYWSGVAKALNHLSLGLIDVRGDTVNGGEDVRDDAGADKGDLSSEITGVAGNETAPESEALEAVFDGYVEESTEVRKQMTRNGLAVWGRDLKTMMLGVGIGGAGEAMYEAGLTDSPKEIIQNEYASVLTEMGIVGAGLAIFTVGLIVVAMAKSRGNALPLALVVGYGVSLVFFSGMVNALQIYLIPAAMYVALNGNKISQTRLREKV